jgi:hypothetical protein
MENVILELNNKGFVHIPNFLDKNDFSEELIEYLKKTKKNPDGVIYPIPDNYLFNIKKKISTEIDPISTKLNILTSKSNRFICSIRINESKIPFIKQKEFNIHKDPKIAQGGALNWHIDHFSYFFFNDHKNWLISYMPIFKKDKYTSNIALVPYDILIKEDINLYNKIKDRGAMRFRVVEEDTIDWFKKRFIHENSIKVGDWFAIDDYNDNENGFKINIDLEKHKIVPLLNEGDLLLVKADIIHKTEDTNSFRISIRCDLMPKYCPKINSVLHWLFMIIKLPFVSYKVRYNYINYMKSRFNLF